MNFILKLVLGMLFWDLLEGCEEVPEELCTEEFDIDEMEWD